MKRAIHKLLLLVGLATWLSAGLAQDDRDAEPELLDAEERPRYRIELIVFAYREFDPNEEFLEVVPHASRFNPKRRMPERRYVDTRMLRAIERQVDGPIAGGPSEGVLPPFSDDLLAIDDFNRELDDLGLRVLDPAALDLRDEYATLERVDAYTPLFHGGWEQYGLSEDVAVDVELSALGAINPTGAIRLHVSRFLHARIDLAYRPLLAAPPRAPIVGDRLGPVGRSDPLAPRALSEPVYYLYEERRVFRDEINYFDHPALGVILRVTLAPALAPDVAPELAPGGVSPSA